jgi:MFS family permease
VLLPRRLSILGWALDFRLLFLATLGSGFGTYLAAVALSVDVYDRTGSLTWVSALLLVEFLPIIAIGLTLGPLVDRLSRRGLMVVSDLVRFGVFCLLPFATGPLMVVVLAAVAGVATGFFRPAVYAGLPNLVPDDQLPTANSLLQAVENIAWMVGPVLGGALLAVSGPDLAYWINAITFLVSAALIVRIPAARLRSEQPLTKGHWRDLAEGFALVRRSRALLTVLVVWNVVLLGSGAVNVAEIALAKESLDAGDFGFGLLVGATGLGLTLGSLAASGVLERYGIRATYAGSMAVMALGFGLAAIAPSVWLAAVFAVAATTGNGIAIVCNVLLVQRGAPDRLRGRAFTLIISSNYALMGAGMALAGPFTNTYGARWTWGVAAMVFALGSAVALAMASRLGENEAELVLHEPEPVPEPQRAAVR